MNECVKIKFFSKEQADAELRNIVESNDYRTWKRITPKRVYECEFCSTDGSPVYHLTSKISITY